MNKNQKLPQDLMEEIKRAVAKQEEEAEAFAQRNFKPDSDIRRIELNQIAIAYAASDITNPVLSSTRIQTTRTARCAPDQAEKLIKSRGTPIAITRSGGNVYTHLREDGRGQLEIIWASGVEVTIKFFFGESPELGKSVGEIRLNEFLGKVEHHETGNITKNETLRQVTVPLSSSLREKDMKSKKISYTEAIRQCSVTKKNQFFLRDVPFAWRRMWAKFIDIAVARIAFEIVGHLIVSSCNWQPPYSTQPILSYVGTWVAFVAFLIVLETITLTLFKTTLGKSIFGISVLRWDLNKPDLGDVAGRTWLSYMSGTWFLIGFPVLTFVAAHRAYNRMKKSKREASWDSDAGTMLMFSHVGYFRLTIGILLGVLAIVTATFFREAAKKYFREDFRIYYSSAL